MSKCGVKMHPGARMFGNAMAGIVCAPNHRKSKSVVLKDIKRTELNCAESQRQRNVADLSVSVHPKSLSVLLENKTPMLQDNKYDSQENSLHVEPQDEEDYSLPLDIYNNYQENTIHIEPHDEVDYSLPLNIYNDYQENTIHVEPQDEVDYSLPLDSYNNYPENSISNQFPADKDYSLPLDTYNYYQENCIPDESPDKKDYSLPLKQSFKPPGFKITSARFPSPHFYTTPTPFCCSENLKYYSADPFSSPMVAYDGLNPLFSCPNQELEPSDVYAFQFSEKSVSFADPGDVEKSSVSPLDISTDYSLPLTLPEGSQDSGCLSSEENSSDTFLNDLPCSLSYYHMANSSEKPSSPQKVLTDSSPEDVPSQAKVNSVISGRVSRRSIPRIQGMPSQSTNEIKITPILRKNLPIPIPQYVDTEVVSDDSGAYMSNDEDPLPPHSSYNGCRSCENESALLYKDDSRKRWRTLPDYSRLNFLSYKSSPGFIDSHCHLDFLFQRQNYDGMYADYMLRHRDTYPAAYEGCVAVFCNPHTFHKTRMWQKYLKESGVWGAFGCHPHNANAYSDLTESDLQEALRHSKVRALGEIGLDYSNRNDCSKERQHLVFRRQLKIALNHKLPLVIHCRDANEDLMRIMKEILPKNYLIHLHCFTDGWDWGEKWLREFPNLFIGITNLVTYSSAEPTHQVVKKIPLDRLLLETDTPYFIPRMSPRSTKYSHPGMAIHVAAQIATLRNVPLKEIIHRTRLNTKKMYGI